MELCDLEQPTGYWCGLIRHHNGPCIVRYSGQASHRRGRQRGHVLDAIANWWREAVLRRG